MRVSISSRTVPFQSKLAVPDHDPPRICLQFCRRLWKNDWTVLPARKQDGRTAGSGHGPALFRRTETDVHVAATILGPLAGDLPANGACVTDVVELAHLHQSKFAGRPAEHGSVSRLNGEGLS